MKAPKAFVSRKIDNGTCDPVPCVEAYLKSEADRYIAHLKRKRCDHIRTRAQGDTPFFPNMLNNANVEVCLKEDVDEAIAELKAKVKFCSDFEFAARKDIEEMRGQHTMLKQLSNHQPKRRFPCPAAVRKPAARSRPPKRSSSSAGIPREGGVGKRTARNRKWNENPKR